MTAKNPTAYVKVSDSVKVGEKAHLVVATIGDRTVVLGVTEHGVRRLMDVHSADRSRGREEDRARDDDRRDPRRHQSGRHCSPLAR